MMASLSMQNPKEVTDKIPLLPTNVRNDKYSAVSSTSNHSQKTNGLSSRPLSLIWEKSSSRPDVIILLVSVIYYWFWVRRRQNEVVPPNRRTWIRNGIVFSSTLSEEERRLRRERALKAHTTSLGEMTEGSVSKSGERIVKLTTESTEEPPCASGANTSALLAPKTPPLPISQQKKATVRTMNKPQDNRTVQAAESPKSKKPKKETKMKTLPPNQLLCEALSRAFDIQVISDGSSEEHPATASTAGRRVIRLKLTIDRDDAVDPEEEGKRCPWIDLLNCMEVSQAEAFIKQLPQQPPSIRKCVEWHAKLFQHIDSLRHARVPTEFISCLQGIALRLRQCVKKQLDEQAAAAAYEDKEIIAFAKTPWVQGTSAAAVTNDLFAEDYAPLHPSLSEANRLLERSRPSNPAQEFLSLLHDPLLADIFVQDVLSNKTTSIFILQQLVQDIAQVFDGEHHLVAMSAIERCTTFLTCTTRSTAIQQALASTFHKEWQWLKEESRKQFPSGQEVERKVLLQPLFAMAAYTTPLPQLRSSNLWQRQLSESIPTFPVGVFTRDYAKAVLKNIEQARLCQQSAQEVAQSILCNLIKRGQKQEMFDWIRYMAQSNEPLVYMLRGELMSSDGMTAISSSWPFLLGLTWTFLGVACPTNLSERMEKMGVTAFDKEYISYYMSEDKSEVIDTKRKTFDGATEVFFLGSLLLRSSLYPLLRIKQEYHHRYGKFVAYVQKCAHANQPLPPHLESEATKVVGTWFGLDALLNDPKFMQVVTQFALLQLDWVYGVIMRNSSTMKDEPSTLPPDWFVKEPSRWLAHVAHSVERSLKPVQADRAVKVTTQLLSVGSRKENMSPVVLTELIRVAAAFVRAGVSRARYNEKYKGRGRRRAFRKQQHEDNEDHDLDERKLNTYHTFDRSDLGVTVFTNRMVCQELCPTLMQTFQALDIVEGLDVDKEASFEKFDVKIEITELMLRLWGHPNGECRASIVRQPVEDIGRFFSSVAAAVGYLLDDACQRFADVAKAKRRPHPVMSTPREQSFVETQTNGAVSNFLCSRRLLLLLSWLSLEPKIASCVGSSTKVAADMSAMIVHFLDILTSGEGGTHTDLDLLAISPEKTLSMASRERNMSDFERKSLATAVVRARVQSYQDYGVDISIFAHQFLALAARWCFATTDSTSPCTTWLAAMAAQEDCDVFRYRAILSRLIPKETNDRTMTSENAAFVFQHDGYQVDGSTMLSGKNTEHEINENTKKWRHIANQDQMTHEEIDDVAKLDRIKEFLQFLEAERNRNSAAGDQRIFEDDLLCIQKNLMSEETNMSEDDYGSILAEWTVSSEPFASSNETFYHFFDKTAKGHGMLASGKLLVKEARKCHRGIPLPHPNSAIYVCFSEERMDLCRAVVTGPVDTPYAHGLFVFDVYFPPPYPHIPPLVQFMTTGGGQIRFGPNLYQDGKVCLSLLGTFHSSDESQKWNPQVSSLAQILLSIQTQLLTSEPYFNEPGHEGIMRTVAGQDGSRRYNSKLRLYTLRHAIIDQLREPPLGFEHVSTKHFSLCRHRILAQARRWMLEAEGSELKSRYSKAYRQLVVLLSADKYKIGESLPPLKDDREYLNRVDPSFLQGLSNDNDRKSAAITNNAVEETSNNVNPWA